MSGAEILPVDIWSRILDLSDVFSTVFVAILVAIIATRRETNKQLVQRHFDFRDGREKIYVDMIAKMNNAIGLYFGCEHSIHHGEEFDLDTVSDAALDFETSTLRAQIQVPEFVAHACLNLNGRIQILVGELGQRDAIGMHQMEFEAVKRNMLKVMKVDIRLIEKTSNRISYTKLVANENRRYFKELNMAEPSS